MPVVILTARSGLVDTVVGFEEGADDYIAKPFRVDEVVARVRAPAALTVELSTRGAYDAVRPAPPGRAGPVSP